MSRSGEGVRVPFAYLEKFMQDCFLAAGMPEEEARLSAEVLIEADKRGIDSHGIGRLKPIYFDRFAKVCVRAVSLGRVRCCFYCPVSRAF